VEHGAELGQAFVESGTVMARRRSFASAIMFCAFSAVTVAAVVISAAVVYGALGQAALATALGLVAFVQLSILIGNQRRVRAGAAALDPLAHEPDMTEWDETAVRDQSVDDPVDGREEPGLDDMSTQSPATAEEDEATGEATSETVSETTSEPPGQTAREPSHAAEPATGIDLLDHGKLDLQLEPVVELTETRTVYYRSNLALTRQDGSRVGPYLLSLSAESGGFAPVLDLALFRRVCPVIRHLKSRSRRPGVFCPLSPQSFAERGVLDELVDFLRVNQDAAGGMVIEISQSDLAGLSPAGMEGLAYLAELGATLSLSEARLEGPDPATLVLLGFRFFDIDTAALASVHGWEAFDEDGEICSLARRAEEAGLTVIAANVARSEDLERVRPFARLARGSLFSPPRVVRRDIADVPARAAAA
jgi:EAL domain-containing protein (putative c-di-GMP-specific phosphodiesterase class I)